MDTLKSHGLEMIPIPAGAFTMGDADLPECVRHPVTLSAYSISKTPVTVGQYRAYCADQGKDFKSFKTPKWGWIDDDPMVNVTLQEARDFCRWAGGDLPTDAQWEKAARGTDGRKYPCGNAWDGSRLQWSADGKFGSALKTASVNDHPTGASPYGCLDMAGNVWQWCRDYYAPIKSSAKATDPTGPKTGEDHVLRGGSWGSEIEPLFRTAARAQVPNDEPSNDIGFRLATTKND